MSGVADLARAWARAGLVDVEFYGALRGRMFADDESAADDFVRVGMARRLSTHPFLDFHSLDPDVRRQWRAADAQGVLDRLWDGATHRLVGPLASHPEPERVRAAMVDLARQIAGTAGEGEGVVRPRFAPDTAVSVVLVASAFQPSARAVRRVREESPAAEVVVVDHGLPAAGALGLHARALRDDATVVRVPGLHSYGEALRAGVEQSHGSVIALLAPSALVRAGWLAPLQTLLRDDETAAAVPLFLDDRDLIAHPGGLHQHPAEDALALAGAALDPAPPDLVLVRAADLRHALGAADADVWRTVAGTRSGGARLAPAARVTTLVEPRVVLPSPSPREDGERGRRWCLQLPSPAGVRGDRWGDTHFAEALAGALRRLGRDVVVRRREAHGLGPVHLDHVTLTLRGLRAFPPVEGTTNVLWVISHPDDVDPRELDGYDVVCAGSPSWARELSERAGRPVVPLLQASEFAPVGTPAGEPTVVFVGQLDARRDRPMVQAALEAGVPLAVYGGGWHDLPDGVWRGEYVENDRLAAVYAEHGIVLSDHWPDMAERGFVANRVFDAVAAGARVISDPVVGLDDVFNPAWVRVATTPQELRAAYDELRAAPAPDPGDAPDVSFDDRARRLVDLVEGLGSG